MGRDAYQQNNNKANKSKHSEKTSVCPRKKSISGMQTKTILKAVREQNRVDNISPIRGLLWLNMWEQNLHGFLFY